MQSMKTNTNWEQFKQNAEGLKIMPSHQAWEKLEQKMKGQKHTTIIGRPKPLNNKLAFAASFLLIALAYLGIKGNFFSKQVNLAGQIEDISREQVVAESFMAKVEWSAQHLDQHTPIMEGSGSKKLVPRTE